MKRIIILAFSCFFVSKAFPQGHSYYSKGIFYNSPAAPFLLISTDARGGGLGNSGAASSPDVNSMVWNPAKYAFIDKTFGISASCSPWFSNSDSSKRSLYYFTCYKKLGKLSTIAASFRYFDQDSVEFNDIKGNSLGTYHPIESAFDLSYSRKLSENFSAGLTGRYIYSNLTNGIPLPNGTSTHAGQALAADISAYYLNDKINFGTRKAEVGGGLNISNIGTKISYTDGPYPQNQSYIPTQARLGGSLKIYLDNFNSIAFLSDLAQLLVPYPLVYSSPERELKKLNRSLGTEYWYNNFIAVRFGYYHEDSLKGDHQYLTFGAGIRYKILFFDIAYYEPVTRSNPLQNKLVATLSFNFYTLKRKNIKNQ